MSAKEKVLISACLIGENVKYNGKNNLLSNIEELKKRFELIPFCPEVEGGLSTPRPPSEIISQDPVKIINKCGKDVTKFFINGAQKTLETCLKFDIKKAILKSNSPSCGKDFVYDGTFSNNLINAEGVTARLLRKNNIRLFTERSF